MTLDASPWSQAGTSPVPGAGPRVRIDLALHTALTAPSLGNAQPWRWFVGGEVIELYRDPARCDSQLDPDGQAALLACGAGLGALRVALCALGLGESTVLLPGGHPDLLARVAVAGAVQALPEEQWLYQAAPKRRTYRAVMASRPASRSLLRRLPVVVAGTGAEVRVVEDLAGRQAIAASVEAAIAGEDPALVAARASAGEASPTFEGPDGLPARGERIAEGSPTLVLVSTETDGPEDWLRAGQALMRVLLRARVDHAWASFLHVPLRTSAGRRQLGGPVHAQALIRLGLGSDLPAAPRRPLRDVLLAQRPGR